MTHPISKTLGICWPVEKWPPADQLLWAKACAPVSLFDDEGGGLHHLAAVSRRKYAKGWGRFIAFLSSSIPAALALSPADRLSKANVQAYVDHLRASGNADYSIISRLEELVAVAAALDASFDPKLIHRFISVLKAKVRPVRNKAHIPMANELVDLGFQLMASASDPSKRKDAMAFRDGLMIAFLALHPVRRRNLLAFHIGKNLVRQGEGYMVVFAGSETKTGTPQEADLAKVLVEPMNKYLSVWRPALMAREGRRMRAIGTSVWVSSVASPMSPNGLSGRIEMRTRKAFGKAINPHAFRDAAATTLAVVDPIHVRSAAPLLGHRSLATTEKHYIHAKGLEAQRSYLELLKTLKKERSRG